MTEDTLKLLKENAGILYIYKIPCSLTDFQYVVVGDIDTKYDDYDCYFNTKDWFALLHSGSLLPYTCATIGKKGKIKETVNIYEKPNLLAFRKYILTSLLPLWRQYQELVWADQIMIEFKVNRFDVFKKVELNSKLVKNELAQFLHKIEPMFHKSVADNKQ